MTATIVWLRDLRTPGEAIDDQGLRRVCLALAITHAHAHEAGRSLSAEYLHWRSGVRGRRGTLSAAALAAQLDGQPDANQWPFSSEVDDTADEYGPPIGVVGPYSSAALTPLDGFDQVATTVLEGNPAVLALQTTAEWYRPGVSVLTEQYPIRAGHAVAAVGVGVATETLSPAWRRNDRLLLIRNSWGAGWGRDGHAVMTERVFNATVDASLRVRLHTG